MFDFESQPDRQRLQNPDLVLGPLTGLVILDEIQLLPELFSVLRVLVDWPDNHAHYLILGSASPALVKQASETLAGRVEFIVLSGFDLSEVGVEAWERLWVRGGFPRAYLAESDQDSQAWREGYIRTFLERDIPQLGITISAPAMRRFWSMLAHYHGQILNASELARSMGVSDKTARSFNNSKNLRAGFASPPVEVSRGNTGVGRIERRRSLILRVERKVDLSP